MKNSRTLHRDIFDGPTSTSTRYQVATFALALAVSSVASAAIGTTAANAQESRFPWVMPWDDASRNVADVSFLNPAPLNNTHRISVRNGHFYDTTGRRVRIMGTNFGSGANFPFKEDAPKIAARLHKLGFNMVRLHHMDATWANPGIFGKDRDNANSVNEVIDRESLDLLDHLVYQLKQHGIYVDLNLHVSWAPNAAASFPDTDKLPELGKVTSYFEKRSIEHQKNYARQFLTHFNPYTKMTWADDPAVALIEITNEDTLLGEGWGDRLLDLPPYYRDQLQAGWNAFLKQKYTNTAAMRRAWMPDVETGPNILRNAQFAEGTQGWTLERQQGAFDWSVEDLGDLSALPENSRPQGRAMHLKVSEVGDAGWRQQFHQTGLDFADGENYTIQFWARADKARTVPMYVGLDQDPWRHIGADARINLTPQWKRYSVLLTANNPVVNHNRLSFSLGESTGDVWLADFSVRRGIVLELEPGQTIEAGSIPLTRAAGTPQGRDYIAYLIEVEREYSEGMRSFIKNDLKSKSLVTCSQAWLGGLGGVLRESRMDWVDHHAYWQHPNFPRQPWDAKDWTIGNTAMVREVNGGTFPSLAMHRVEGKPFTVSEYNHPAPNEYAAETMPLLAAYAAWQDWDGIFLFSYNGDRNNWKSDRIRGFFDADADPNKMAMMPAASMIFLGNQVQPASLKKSTLVVPRGGVVNTMARNGLAGFWDSNVGGLWNVQDSSRQDWLQSHMALRFVEGSGPIKLERVLTPTNAPNQVEWHTDSPQTSLFIVRAPSAKGALGFLGGQWIDLGGVVISMERTPRNFVSMTLTAMDNKPVQSSRRLLLTALDNVENQGMTWNAERTSVSDQWGTGPAMAAGIAASVTMRTDARSATVYALDATGARGKQVPSSLTNGILAFRISPQQRTLWYEIVAA
jgi:hypothetical protein